MPESGGNDNFWNSLLTAGMSMYASGKKKKEENKQLDWMNSILADKRRYEDEKIARYKSSPAAQMSPMIMEMLVNAYGPKFKKYGIDMPLDKMLAAINGGSQGPSGASGGTSDGAAPQRTLSQIANGEGVNLRFQARSDGTFGPANTTMKNGTQYTMGKLDPEIEEYNGKDWGDKIGFVDGDAFAREKTHSGTGNAGWTKDSNGRKIYVGSLATGGNTAYTPSKTTTSDWRDTIVHNGGFEPDAYQPTPEQVIGGEASAPVDDKVGFLEWLQNVRNKHPVLWGIGKTVGNVIAPGLPNLASGAIDPLVARGFGDGQARNAGITKIGNRKRGGKWG